MKIFNTEKPKEIPEKPSGPDELDVNIEARKKELATLKDLLRGMRLEVANLMSEIKYKNDEIASLKEAKNKVEKEIAELNENYQELKNSFVEKQDTILFLDKTISEIRKEIEEASSKPDKMDSIKAEYDDLVKQISEEKLKLFKLKSERKLLLKDLESSPPSRPFGIGHSIKEKKCKAKTASGKKCNKTALPGKDFCALHLKQKTKKQ